MLPKLRQSDTSVYVHPRLTERPGWIPDDIPDGWDPDPYAYQTEEESMPAGNYHGLFLSMIVQMLDGYVQPLGFTMLQDAFVCYRDEHDKRQRLAPDIMLAPMANMPDELLERAYNLDVDPAPTCVIEITSPGSHKHDLEEKCLWYALWGVEEYLVFDIVDRKRVRQHVQCSLWRLYGNSYLRVIPDSAGYLHMQRIGVKVRAVGRQPELRVLATNALLHTKQQEAQRAQTAEDRVKQLEEEIQRLRSQYGDGS
jgi:Uma2 family endonuclease